MTYGYDVEMLVVALDNVENAARQLACGHKLEDWFSHRVGHIRGEAKSLKDEIEKHKG